MLWAIGEGHAKTHCYFSILLFQKHSGVPIDVWSWNVHIHLCFVGGRQPLDGLEW